MRLLILILSAALQIEPDRSDLFGVDPAPEALPSSSPRVLRHEGGLTAALFIPHGPLVSAGFDGFLRTWSPQEGFLQESAHATGLPVRVLQLSPGGDLLAFAGGADSKIRLRSTRGAPDRLLEGAPGPVLAVDFAPDGKALLAATSDGRLVRWDLRQPAPVAHPLCTLPQAVPSLATLPGDSRLLGAGDHRLRIWDSLTGEATGSSPPLARTISVVAVSRDGMLAATGGPDRRVRLWDLLTLSLLASLKGHEGSVSALAFSPDATRLVSGGYDGTLRVWDLEEGKVWSATAHGWPLTLSVSGEGRWIAAGMAQSAVHVWEAPRDYGRAAPGTDSLPALWEALGGQDGQGAFRAIRELARHVRAGPDAVQFLRARLSPADPGTLEKLIARLDADDPEERQAAATALESHGAAAEAALRALLARKPTPDLEARAGEILQALKSRVVVAAESRSLLRAVQVLERGGTREALDLLALLAKGDRSARLTRDAMAALARQSAKEEPR